MIKIEKDKLYLITGGSGFLGIPLCDRVLKMGGRVRVIARDEGKLVELQQMYPEIEILTGDISDKFEVKQAMKGVNGVFHLAASKHVGIAEQQVRECVKSNTIGSMHILDESLETKPDFVLGISTDKAAQVAGVYGASKLLMERLFGQFERLNDDTKYRLVRYGNVLYSTGSVLCKWKDLLKEGKEIIITDPEATRFFWTVDQAVDLIFDCLETATTYEPHITKMKSMEMGDLLKAMANKYLPDGQELKVKEIGLQPGENKHEIITSEGLDSSKSERFTVDEIMEVI
jgi:UDP-N-acetylglucosamine 4,6-dehydratase/UDP-glucose 4-epimerase|tara:strand:+ start:1400 stop:2260 length:861 start_codon:yes stop_codon:yes gene_type:complete